MKLKDVSGHHAVLITHTDRKNVTEGLWLELQGNSLSHRLFDATVLDIETARDIISWARSSYDGERIGLISFHTAGIPAQNALLKVLEEPPQKMRFILITSNTSNLIPTVLSRLQHQDKETTGIELSKEAILFLSSSVATRMKIPFVNELLARTDEEDRKDREAIKGFVLSLLPILSKSHTSSRYIEETLEIASYASDPSSSGKALLEYLSLLLPQQKA